MIKQNFSLAFKIPFDLSNFIIDCNDNAVPIINKLALIIITRRWGWRWMKHNTLIHNFATYFCLEVTTLNMVETLLLILLLLLMLIKGTRQYHYTTIINRWWGILTQNWTVSFRGYNTVVGTFEVLTLRDGNDIILFGNAISQNGRSTSYACTNFMILLEKIIRCLLQAKIGNVLTLNSSTEGNASRINKSSRFMIGWLGSSYFRHLIWFLTQIHGLIQWLEIPIANHCLFVRLIF